MALKGTFSAKPSDINKDWFVVDAEGLVLGRLAVIIANRLRGKHKVGFTPHMACGDNVIVINCEKVLLTGNKRTQKTYYWHTGYPGGLKETKLKAMMEKKPTEALRKAVNGMLPHNSYGRKLQTKVLYYAGEEHNQQAQKPVEYSKG